MLIGPGSRAKFEFKIGDWLGLNEGGMPIAPEVLKLSSLRLLCIQGADDDDAHCEELVAANVQCVKLPGGHHFDGDYEVLANAILEHVVAVTGVR